MTMTKKEREEVRELRVMAALRWTQPVEPDVPPPGHGLTVGYLPVGELGSDPRVSEACSSSISHGLNHTKTTTQKPRTLYSTRLLALKAMRHMLEKRFAEMLANVDEQIAEAESSRAVPSGSAEK
jgi:adenosylmethionine-8-amino-7-oxononanoate aminotransferase